MGCSVLYHLACLGVKDAILVERNKLTSGTTWHSAAQVRALRSTRSLTDLIRYSIDLYSRLESETGQNVGWINKGSLSIATNENRLTHIRRQASLAGLFGVSADVISPDEALERWRLMDISDVIGAVWSPDDGRVSPSDLCSALVKGAKSRGARIYEDTGVTGIMTHNNRVTGIETTSGEIRADSVVLCSGLWSRRLALMADVSAPVWSCEHFYLLTGSVPGLEGNLPTLSDHDGHLYIRDDSGGLLVGCFEPMGKVISPDKLDDNFEFQLLDEDWDHFEPMMHNALHRIPSLADADVRMLLNGPESFTPDGNFLLGESTTRGFFLGCGMNSVGVATAGGAGMALAQMITEGTSPMDLHEVDPKRFDTSENGVSFLEARVPEVLGRHYEIGYPGRQWTTSRDAKFLELHDEWKSHSAHFGQVFGYERPLYFNKTSEPRLTFKRPDWFELVGREVKLATSSCVMTDLSSFGKIDIRGRDSASFLDRVCTSGLSKKPAGRVSYTFMLNELGGIVSDLTVLRFGEDYFRLHVGTMSRHRDLHWLRGHLRDDEDVTIEDVTLDYVILGIMGPRSSEIFDSLGCSWINKLGYFCHGGGKIADTSGDTSGDISVEASRLSYIGEAGCEVTCSASDAHTLYNLLNELGVVPIGSYSQTSMRIEKGYVSYGHDIDTDVTPLSLGVGLLIDWSSPFVGRDALVRLRDNDDVSTKLVSLVFDDLDPDINYYPIGDEVIYDGLVCVGKTTSCSYGYRVGRYISLGLVSVDCAVSGRRLGVEVNGVMYNCRVELGCLYDSGGFVMRLE